MAPRLTSRVLRPLCRQQSSLRAYHDESFGFRKGRVFELPDCAYAFYGGFSQQMNLLFRYPRSVAKPCKQRTTFALRGFP